jgi:small subunit ribosomal protein S1
MAVETQPTSGGGGESFAALFEASVAHADSLREGDIVSGTVVGLAKDSVIVDIGYKSEGMISLSEFTDPGSGEAVVSPGDRVDVLVESKETDDGLVLLSKEKADKLKVWDEISAACERDELIEGTITARVKGGLSVTIKGGVKAFLPGSQVDLRPVRNLDKLIGQSYEFKVIKFNKKRGNIVLSRRVLLERERDEQKSPHPEEPGGGPWSSGRHQEHHRVRRLHRPRRHRRPAPHHRHELGPHQPPERALQRRRRGHGQGPQVQPGDRARQPRPQADPSRIRGTTPRRSSPRHDRPGKVVSLTDYGAFIELEPGIEGLIHVSEMSWTQARSSTRRSC